MAKGRNTTDAGWQILTQEVSEDGRKTSALKELSYQSGALLWIETTYRHRDGTVALNNAMTFVPETTSTDSTK